VTESSEQSYYEIALTNRQAIVFFVFMLVFILLVFLSGVWVGRSGQKEMLAKARLEAAASSIELAGIPEVQVGPRGNQGNDEVASPPDLSSLEAPKSGPSTLAEDLGSAPAPPDASSSTAARNEPEPTRFEPPPAPARTEPQREEPARPEESAVRNETAQPPAVEPDRPATVAPTSGFVIQVFSTKDESQARKVLGDLKGAGFKAYLSPVKVGTSTMFRVRIGPFDQRSQADQTAVKVKDRFRRFETWVTAATN